MKKVRSIRSIHRFRNRFKVFALFIGVLVSAASIQAAVLVSYDMEDPDYALRITPSFTNADVTATALSLSPGPSIVYNGPEVLINGDTDDDYTVWSPTLAGGTNALDALAQGNYFYLTVTPDPGKMISLDSFSFNTFAGTAGPSARQIYVFSDKTGYLSANVLISASTESGSPTIPYNDAFFGQNFSVDLSGNASVSNITDSVTFRIYLQCPDFSQNIAFDDITVNGTVTNAPLDVVLASWDMETSPNSARQIASFVNTNVTVSNLSPNTNTLNAAGSFIPANVVGGAGDDYIAYSRSAGFAQTNALGVIADDTYFSLTITPDEGKSISLTSISFDAMAGTAGPSDRQFYLMSDKTGYLSTAVLASASTVTGSPLMPYNTSTFDQNFSADLSGISAFSNIVDSITFRFYIATPTTFQNVGFDDIIVKGIIDDAVYVPGDVSIALEGTSVILSWEAYAAASYSVQSKTDLVGGTWGTTQSGLTGVTGTMYATNSMVAPACFYRVVIETP